MEHLKLSDGEWKLMKMLWARQPQTLAELVTALDADTGWSRATIFMMVSNLVGRGALSEQEIQELKAILDAAEKQEESSC